MEKENETCGSLAALERSVGKITSWLPAKRKVAVMEFLLTQPVERLKAYLQDSSLPAFFVLSTRMLWDNHMEQFMNVLRTCREMEQEDAEKSGDFH